MPGHWTEFVEVVAGEDRLLSWKAVQKETGLSRTTAWRLQKDGQFPASVVLSPGRVGYRQREIEAWKRSRVPRREHDPVPATKPAATRTEASLTAGLIPEPEHPSFAPPLHRASASRGRIAQVSAEQLALDF